MFAFQLPTPCDKRLVSLANTDTMASSISAYSVMCRTIGVHNDPEIARNSSLFRINPQRCLALRFVKEFPIDAASPFNLGEHPTVRDFLSLNLKSVDITAVENEAGSYMSRLAM